MSTGKLGERMPLKSYFEQYQHNQDLVSIAASFLVHIFRMELQTYQVHMSTGKNKLSTHTNDIWSEASRFISKAQVSRMHWYSLLNIVPNDEYMSLQLVKLDFFILAFELLQMMAHPALAKAIILEAAATLTHSPWSPFTGVKNQQDPSIWQTSQFVEDFALPITVAAMASRSSFRRLFPNRCQPCPAWPYSAPCDLHSILLLPALFLDETFKLKVLRLSTMILMQFRWPTVDTERLLAQLGIEGPESRSSDNLNWRMSLALCARARVVVLILGKKKKHLWGLGVAFQYFSGLLPPKFA
ncbi:hypothetical protein BJ085DRAFT_41589 [Dimargaris cristalligena]|uniref:Uncharacterized protein n=1 Tax=Dimargaris cristalligena TaxID=215637 RepID=A0A4P9ZSN3_9FUNG|nr:hypothetical protein BJ085DRAFT_41589 [Dimargaris cristalligena]|eukprot:RKP36586.1 hypothetical protein BJ085DRAFT_41589 [Dimargaris cristalligena]